MSRPIDGPRHPCSAVLATPTSFALALLLIAVAAVAQDDNVLVIVVDDLGIEHVEDYGLQTVDPEYAPLTNLQLRLDGTDNWLRFDRAWSNPFCSPTRSTIQTGLYGRATGVGSNIGFPPTNNVILDTDDTLLLAKQLQNEGYDTAAFGKTS